MRKACSNWKNIVITNESSGVGLAIARDLYKDYHVVFVGITRGKSLGISNQLDNKVDTISLVYQQEKVLNMPTHKYAKHFQILTYLFSSAIIMSNSVSKNIANNLNWHYELNLKLKSLLKQGCVLLVSGNLRTIHMLPIYDIQANQMARLDFNL